jgi:thiamine-phosphate pyrophosphorylase
MRNSCLLYYITDRKAFPGDDETQRHHLLAKIGEASRAGVHYIQLREKDLPTRELEALAKKAVSIIQENSNSAADKQQLSTVLLINARTDVALAVNAGGVHLPANDISPEDVRQIWMVAEDFDPARQRANPKLAISVSCHSIQEVMQAAATGADLALLAPIFEKKDAPTTQSKGIEALRDAAHANIPVLALAGVTLANAEHCIRAGAAGIAAIRLFQENDIGAVARTLRKIMMRG